jgi:hypothetical protein
MEERIKKLEDEMVLVKDRNKKVEVNKAWETSKIRIASILLLTYIFASIALYFIGVSNFLLNAVIPTLGFFLSIQSLPFIKKWWISKNIK